MLTRWRSRRRLVLLFLLLLVGLLGYRLWRVGQAALALRDDLKALQALADADRPDITAATTLLRETHADLLTLRREAGPFLPLTRYLGWVPRWGGEVRAAPDLLAMALSLTEAGVTALDGVEPLLALAQGEAEVGPEGPMALVVRTLDEARPQLEQAQTLLADAQARRAAIADEALSPRVRSLLARLDRYLPLAQAGLDLALVAPDLLGGQGERRYLILVQNNDELRATGGFISAAGLLTLDAGQIVDLRFEDSYDVDDWSRSPLFPSPPEPIRRYMLAYYWVFRDANWSPDFPTSARKAAELYRLSRDADVDGVIAVDQQAVVLLLAPLAPLQVPNWEEPVTGENLIPMMRRAWSPSEEEKAKVDWESQTNWQWWQRRKAFMGDLVAAARAKLEGNPGEVDWTALGRALYRALEERHLLLWLSEPEAARLLARQGWDGALQQTGSDYLMVVDSNIGFNKVNALVEERIVYEVTLEADGAAQATLTIHYRNPSRADAPCRPSPHYGEDYEAIMHRCYWDYLRVYVPAGSRLLSGQGVPIPAEMMLNGEATQGEIEQMPGEAGKAVFATVLMVPRQGEAQVRLTYRLPAGVVERTEEGWRYHLLVQKQAGTLGHPLQVVVRLPAGAEVLGSRPAGTVDEAGRWVYTTRLTTDQQVEVRYRFAP